MSRTASRAVLLGLGACGLGLAVLLLKLAFFERGQVDPAVVAERRPAGLASPQTTSRDVDVLEQDACAPASWAAVSAAVGLKLPNGSMVRPLNGVSSPPPLQWPIDRAWSPIRRRIVDRKGTEWYEHADGSYSTTLLVDRSDLGRSEAVTHVVHPEAAAQVSEELDKLGGARSARRR